MANRKSLILLATALLAATTLSAQNPIRGDWNGKLSTGATNLTLVFHLPEGGGCTMDSPDQGARGIPAEVLYNDGDSLQVRVAQIGVEYGARMNDGKLVGVFKQSGLSLPLELTPGVLVRRRPQTPVAPFPYTTKELRFTSSSDGANLAGTLVLPEKAGKKTPLVVMVSGSGQQNRDEELFEHKPFAVIADHLARNGIASFRYDDRGVGESDGLREDLTTEINAQDALSAVRMLRGLGLTKKIGILGHSEGGLIAFMLAGNYPKEINFIVSLAGTAVKGDEVLGKQIMRSVKAAGQELSSEDLKELMKQQALSNPWYKFFISYDPAEAISRIKCPVFAANGTLDVQVLAEDNIGSLELFLPPKMVDQIKTYKGLNHLFQHAVTGDPSEYAEIEETISEEVLHDLSSWINIIRYFK